jgi:hypothetical protein
LMPSSALTVTKVDPENKSVPSIFSFPFSKSVSP